LIDSMLKMWTSCSTEINGRWAVAKPVPMYGLEGLVERVYHAWLVLVGKATAVQYVEDRIGKRR